MAIRILTAAYLVLVLALSLSVPAHAQQMVPFVKCGNNNGLRVGINVAGDELVANVFRRDAGGQYQVIKQTPVRETTTRGVNKLYVGQGFGLGIVIPYTGIPTTRFSGTARVATGESTQYNIDEQVVCSFQGR